MYGAWGCADLSTSSLDIVRRGFNRQPVHLPDRRRSHTAWRPRREWHWRQAYLCSISRVKWDISVPVSVGFE